jgi:hypothetical protein
VAALKKTSNGPGKPVRDLLSPGAFRASSINSAMAQSSTMQARWTSGG